MDFTIQELKNAKQQSNMSDFVFIISKFFYFLEQINNNVMFKSTNFVKQVLTHAKQFSCLLKG